MKKNGLLRAEKRKEHHSNFKALEVFIENINNLYRDEIQ
jgi:hypothetical protein